MLNLKSHHRTPDPAIKFACLIEPFFVSGEINSDEELYASVRTLGYAIIQEYKSAGSLECNPAIELTPEEFERNWKGD